MLHDTIEDTTVTMNVDKAFGEESGLVDGLTKLGRLDHQARRAGGEFLQAPARHCR
jgi:(p)ppGpp synthase/HD superfamily hydrolase